MRRNIVLTGFMATGKSAVGRLLADRLAFEFVDTDAVIEERWGPIPTIFAEHGEATFRAHEREVADELAGRDGLVIATGGGMLVDITNAETLAASGDVFCLVATPAEIHRRVLADAPRVDRPLLATTDPMQRITELLDERAEAYERFPQIVTDGRTPADIADEIASSRTD